MKIITNPDSENGVITRESIITKGVETPARAFGPTRFS
jgi:hypothetical protein